MKAQAVTSSQLPVSSAAKGKTAPSKEILLREASGTATIYDRVVDILDSHIDVGIVDCADGRSILTWDTTQQLATAIATDTQLAKLIRRQNLDGAA